jgi:multiple sugar transport system substrate-binding protein
VKAFTIMQRWFTQGYVDPNATGDAFEESRSPISWIGHWFYDRYSKAFPGDIRIVPLPNFGERTATDSGSWQWGITSNATDGDAVWRFLQFLLRPAEVLRMTRANGAIPATRSAVRISPDFAAGGPKHLYIEQLEDGVARSRPQTPGLSRAQRRIRTCIQRGGSPGTTRWLPHSMPPRGASSVT